MALYNYLGCNDMEITVWTVDQEELHSLQKSTVALIQDAFTRALLRDRSFFCLWHRLLAYGFRFVHARFCSDIDG